MRQLPAQPRPKSMYSALGHAESDNGEVLYLILYNASAGLAPDRSNKWQLPRSPHVPPWPPAIRRGRIAGGQGAVSRGWAGSLPVVIPIRGKPGGNRFASWDDVAINIWQFDAWWSRHRIARDNKCTSSNKPLILPFQHRIQSLPLAKSFTTKPNRLKAIHQRMLVSRL